MRERRRGKELERAILDAAWQELEDRGYAGLTMERVAERARTSRTVLARRWDNKQALTIAAIRQYAMKHPLEVTDRGDLRMELLELLDRASSRARGFAAVFTLLSSEYFRDTSSTPQDLRTAITAGHNTSAIGPILDRAVSRGEIDPETLAPPVATLLSDLFRGYVVMNFAPPPPTLREAWVDRIFLPLVRTRQTNPNGPGVD